MAAAVDFVVGLEQPHALGRFALELVSYLLREEPLGALDGAVDVEFEEVIVLAYTVVQVLRGGIAHLVEGGEAGSPFFVRRLWAGRLRLLGRVAALRKDRLTLRPIAREV